MSPKHTSNPENFPEAQLTLTENQKRKNRHTLDTRRKILVGACMLEVARMDPKVQMALARVLDGFLIRPADPITRTPIRSGQASPTRLDLQDPTSGTKAVTQARPFFENKGAVIHRRSGDACGRPRPAGKSTLARRAMR